MNLKPLFRYRLKAGLLGVASYLGVLALVTIILIVVARSNVQTGSMNLMAVGVASAIFFLVWGLTAIREDLQMGLQFGLSRRTMLVANLLAALVLSLVAAAIGELLIAAGQTMVADRNSLYISDFYPTLFLQDKRILSASQHVSSAFFTFTVQWVCYGAGLLLSLLYYRLSKFGMVVLSLTGGLVALVLVPYLAWRFAPQLAPALQWLLAGLGNWSVVMGLLTAALLVGSFLLLRRAPLKTTK